MRWSHRIDRDECEIIGPRRQIFFVWLCVGDGRGMGNFVYLRIDCFIFGILAEGANYFFGRIMVQL